MFTLLAAVLFASVEKAPIFSDFPGCRPPISKPTCHRFLAYWQPDLEVYMLLPEDQVVRPTIRQLSPAADNSGHTWASGFIHASFGDEGQFHFELMIAFDGDRKIVDIIHAIFTPYRCNGEHR